MPDDKNEYDSIAASAQKMYTMYANERRMLTAK